MSSIQLSNKNKSKTKIKYTFGDRVFNFVNDGLLLLAALIVLYPLIYILSSAFSSPEAVSQGRVVFFPVDFSLRGFEEVFSHRAIVTGFANSIFYTVVGTTVNIIMTVAAAYPLSRKELPGRRIFLFMFTFTMLFNGGLIPSYLLTSQLGLINTRSVMIIPLAINVFNVIICRTFFETTIPDELLEASQIDGISHTRFIIQIAMPLSKAIIAVLVLYYGLGHWNSYFQAFLYISDRSKYPLQIILRDILILNQVNEIIADPLLYQAKRGMAQLLKYSLIVVASAPFMVAYPFVAKHFVQGVMIGAVKG
ncbi:MAG: carbohydrate ABC transporter permease [Clostridiaceae bacterium]|nr:carbohydrate ABC transporter permease [Clostridiaceae bacterium]